MVVRRVTLWLGAVLGVIVVLLLASSCTQGGYSSTSAYRYRTMPAFDSPLDATADAIALAQFATASAAEVQAAQAAAEATARAAVYQATADAAQAVLEQQRLLLTQQAAAATAQAQATVDALAVQATAQALVIQATATERAFRMTATADALNRAATATAQARADAATATAQARADLLTATHVAWAGQRTATAEAREATRTAYQATATRAAEQREIVLGYGRDYGIPAVLFLAVLALAWLIGYAIRQQARRPVVIPRNILGDAEPMAVPQKGGGFTFVDLDRQPGSVLQVLPDGTVRAPQLRSAGQEERTTARDQLVDAMTRPRLGAGHKGSNPPSLPMPSPPRAPAPGLRSVRVLRRLDQAARAGALPPTLVEALEAKWEEETEE